MVSREECVTAINNFIKNNSIEEAITLITYLCEVKGISNIEEVLKEINNPVLISFIIPKVIEALEVELKIHRLSKNNTLILVF